MTLLFLLSTSVLCSLLWYQQRAKKVLKDQLLSLQETQEVLLTKMSISSREEERKRFARDWHDNMGNLLSTARLLTDVIETPNPQPLLAVQQLLENAHQVAKDICFDTQAIRLDSNQDLSTFFKELQYQLQLGGIQLSYTLQETAYEEWNQADKWHFCSILKELMTNIIKHAEATQVTIHLKTLNNYTELIVTDNGKGMELEPSFLPKTIMERIRLLNGTVQIAKNQPTGIITSLQIVNKENYKIEQGRKDQSIGIVSN